MNSFLKNLLSDKLGGEIFRLFSGWHFFYIILTFAAITSFIFILNKRNKEAKFNFTKTLIYICFAMYICDFFLMPLAYGEIDIEKLPFHVCTTMCVMCFLSYRIEFLKKYRMSFVKIGLISNLVYLIYPAGVMWHAVGPLSYRVIQTLLFHSVMVVYGVLMLIFESEEVNKKSILRDLIVIVGMTLWAIIGNNIYNGTYHGKEYCFNWFFVIRDPFNMISENVAKFVMPIINIVLFFALEMIINLVFKIISKNKNESKDKLFDNKKQN